MSPAQANRLPIGSYEQAVWRLVTAFEAAGQRSTDEIRFAVEVIADVFWMKDSRVWQDVMAFSRGL
jgi:enolase